MQVMPRQPGQRKNAGNDRELADLVAKADDGQGVFVEILQEFRFGHAALPGGLISPKIGNARLPEKDIVRIRICRRSAIRAVQAVGQLRSSRGRAHLPPLRSPIGHDAR